MIIIEKPYEKRGHSGDGMLFGHGDAKRRHGDISKIVFLCVLYDSDYNLRPEDYRFYKVVDEEPVEVPQTRNFYSGKRNLNSDYYVKKGTK